VHLLDRDVVAELALQAEVAHHVRRIAVRRVGQQDLAAGQAAQQLARPRSARIIARRSSSVVGLAQEVGGA
jgi:hypothetical protein